MEFIVYTLIAIALIVVLFTVKKSFSISSSLDIAATREQIQQRILDFNTWKEWSPWLLHEPDTKIVLSDNYQQEQGFYTWEGKLVGSGKLTHEVIKNGSIDQDIQFIKPFKSKAKTYWRIEQLNGEQCRVTWSMDSAMPLLMAMMIPMIKMGITNDYKIGLLLLAQLLSKKADTFQFRIIGEQKREMMTGNAKILRGVRFDELGQLMQPLFQQLQQTAETKNQEITGPTFATYSNVNIRKKTCDCRCVVPTADGDYHIAANNYFVFEVVGDYQFMELAWYIAHTHLRMLKRKSNTKAPSVEIYQQMADESANNQHNITEILIPLKD